jgi:ornithine carbamoyltransferase
MTASAPTASLVNKDYLSVLDLAPAELHQVLDLAGSMKRDRAAGRAGKQPLARKHIALLFGKPSLRTRMTFIVAVRELGGEVIESPADVVFGSRETIEDVARNLERWVAGVVVRTFAQQPLADFAAAAPRLHVVNALTNEEHPCQALADMLTFREKVGELRGRTLAFIGDGNNVATSLGHAAAMLGVHMRVASPAGFELSQPVVDQCRQVARDGATITLLRDPIEAVQGADAVYTDVWTSMGQENESRKRERIFQRYQVNDTLMQAAGAGALFMHCLPAHRGHEVTDSVMDSAASVVFDQAENRLHTQKALLALLVAS